MDPIASLIAVCAVLAVALTARTIYLRGLVLWDLHGERLVARWEAYLLARSIESLATAARAMHDIDEGRVREDCLAALRARLDDANISGAGVAADETAEGPRGVFRSDGSYEAPGGATWQFGE